MSLTIDRTTTTYSRDDSFTQTRTVTTRREPLTVPTRWSMYTSEGNRRITRMATTLLRKVEKMVAEGKASRANVNRALVAFIASWERMTMSGASDTAVRECVGGFHDDILKAVFGYVGWDEWENNRDEAYRRVRAARKSA